MATHVGGRALIQDRPDMLERRGSGRANHNRRESRAMKKFQDAAYAHAALSATLVVLRVLIKQGLIPRDDAVRAMLDEAVSRAIVAEEERNKGVTGKNAAEINSQSAEILKFIAEKL